MPCGGNPHARDDDRGERRIWPLHGHVATPKDTPVGASVLIQEIFGVNAAMRAWCDRVADLGVLALCPDLFGRQQAGRN